MKSFFFVLTGIIISVNTIAQLSVIEGRVVDKSTNEPVPFANVFVQGTELGSTSDLDGKFRIDNVSPGVYNLEVSALGYSKSIVFELEVTLDRSANVEVTLSVVETELKEAVIVESALIGREEAPLSVKMIGTNEIKRNPGGNRDISRAIRALPGVTFIPSFRNDIVIRGGAPGENRFFIDGIEIPNINHFATQGASGGPVGLINVDLIKEVEFYSGSFPSNRGNALSSVLELEFQDPRKDKFFANMVFGTSDLGVTVGGPTGENSGLIFSTRRSYLQLLFATLGLPFLPTYNDAQFKWKVRLGEKDQVSVLGLGAIDKFNLNVELADDTTNEDFERNIYLLNNLPVNEQWNYTIGARWDHFDSGGRWSLIVSRNSLQNDSYKHEENDESLPLTQDYSSKETENKFRVERKYDKNRWKLVYGLQYELADYFNRSSIYEYSNQLDSTVNIEYTTEYNMNKYGAYAQLSRTAWERRIVWSVGLRTDASDFSSALNKPLDQLSPRAAIRYNFMPQWSLNLGSGIYYQLPSYVILGYNNQDGFANTDVTYIRNSQLLAGIEYSRDKSNTIVSVEVFHKKYSNYPVSDDKGISLANLGADFGILGNENISPVGLGKAYGAELYVQQKLYRGFYGIMAYTFVRSEFTGTDGVYLPSAWDSRHLLSLTGGKRFKGNWEVGARFQLSGGLPYTPDDEEASMAIENWDVTGFAVSDWAKLNTQRINTFSQLDVRVDKKWFFEKWSFDLFLDIQNLFNQVTPLKPTLDVVRDGQGIPIPDADNPGFYSPKYVDTSSGSLLPSIGIIIEL